jgi:sugar phosphate isomerase/epimerase
MRSRLKSLTIFAVAITLIASSNPSRADEVPAHPAAVAISVSSHRYKIAVCDWMILKRQRLGAFELAREIGADGVELDMGSLERRATFANALTNPAVRQQFLDEARKQNVQICSIAMSGLYAHGIGKRSNTCEMIEGCIETMKQMGVKIAFLPLVNSNDMARYPDVRPAIVEKLKTIAPKAEAAGVVMGIETTLDAAGEVKLLEEIGSPAIRIYLNFANALEAGRDLQKELRTLGKDRICQIHCTDIDGAWLQENKRLDMQKVKQTLDEMGWSGWLVIERSRRLEYVRDVKKNFSTNAAYLKSVFQQK